MKKFRITFIAISLMAFIAQSCSTNKKEATEESQGIHEDHTEEGHMHEEGHMNEDHQHENHMNTDHHEKEIETSNGEVSTMNAATVSQAQLESMLVGYFNVKNALVNTDVKQARSAAEKLFANLDAGMTDISDLVKGMSTKEDVEVIRKDFNQLSESMYQLVKANSDKKEITVYKQFCPMALNNKGAFWLSQQEEIKNPYFGDKMLKCGKVQEEL